MTTRQAYVWETRDRSGAGTFYASDDDEARGIAAGKGFGLPRPPLPRRLRHPEFPLRPGAGRGGLLMAARIAAQDALRLRKLGFEFTEASPHPVWRDWSGTLDCIDNMTFQPGSCMGLVCCGDTKREMVQDAIARATDVLRSGPLKLCTDPGCELHHGLRCTWPGAICSGCSARTRRGAS